MKSSDDGLYKKVKEPDVVVGAHVMPERAGVIGTKRGLIASSADRFQCVNNSYCLFQADNAIDSASQVVKPTPQPPIAVSTPSYKQLPRSCVSSPLCRARLTP